MDGTRPAFTEEMGGKRIARAAERKRRKTLSVDERLLQDQGHGAHVPGGDGHAIDLAGRFIKGGYGEARPGLCGKFERSD